MSIGLVFRGERFLTVSDHPLFAAFVRAAERCAPEWTDLQSAEGEKVRKVRHSGTSPFLMPSLRNRRLVSRVADRFGSKMLLFSIIFKLWIDSGFNQTQPGGHNGTSSNKRRGMAWILCCTDEHSAHDVVHHALSVSLGVALAEFSGHRGHPDGEPPS